MWANVLSEADQTADLLNNTIGRNIGGINQSTDSRGLAIAVLIEFHEKGLYTAQQNETGEWVVKRTKISDDQFNSLMEVFYILIIMVGNSIITLRTVVTVGLIMFVSCEQFSLERFVKKELRNHPSDSCIVNFNNLPFEWDSLYCYCDIRQYPFPKKEKNRFFNQYVEPSIACQEDISLLSSIILFKNKGATVYHQSWYYDYEKYFWPVFILSNKQIFVRSKEDTEFYVFPYSQAYIIVDSQELRNTDIEQFLWRCKDSNKPLIHPVRF